MNVSDLHGPKKKVVFRRSKTVIRWSKTFMQTVWNVIRKKTLEPEHSIFGTVRSRSHFKIEKDQLYKWDLFVLDKIITYLKKLKILKKKCLRQ